MNVSGHYDYFSLNYNQKDKIEKDRNRNCVF